MGKHLQEVIDGETSPRRELRGGSGVLRSVHLEAWRGMRWPRGLTTPPSFKGKHQTTRSKVTGHFQLSVV